MPDRLPTEAVEAGRTRLVEYGRDWPGGLRGSLYDMAIEVLTAALPHLHRRWREALLTDEALAASFDARGSGEVQAALDGLPPNWDTRLKIEREAMRAALRATAEEEAEDG